MARGGAEGGDGAITPAFLSLYLTLAPLQQAAGQASLSAVSVANQVAQVEPGLLDAPLPIAYVEATGPVVILPTTDAPQTRAIGEMRDGQRGEVFAVSGDSESVWVWLVTNGVSGVARCESGGDSFVVRSVENGRILEWC